MAFPSQIYSPARRADNVINMIFRKGQIAIETLAMMGIILALIVPILLLFLSQANSKANDLSINQAQASAQKISQTAFEVYAQGAGARKTVSINFPQDLLEVKIGGAANEIVFVLERNGVGQDIVVPCNARIRDISPENSLSDSRYMKGNYIDSGLRPVIFEYDKTDNSVGIGYAD